MERFNSNFPLISFHFLLFIIFSFLHTSTSDSPQGCGTPAANCLRGTCRNTSTPPFFFDCDCDPGWLKPPLLPYCVIPNCTLNLQCGNGAPPPSPPPFSLIQNASACNRFLLPPCCGDGYCVPDGNNYKCECPDGMANLMGVPTLPCFKKSNLGADCNVLLHLAPPPLPPPLPLPPPPPTSSAPPKMGPVDSPNSANYQTLSTILLLIGSLQPWI